MDALCIQNRLHASGCAFGHFKDGNLLGQLVVQVDNRENMPMLAVFEQPHGKRRKHAQVMPQFLDILITNNLFLGNGEARLRRLVSH